jgi:hypothetical protein
MRYRYTCSSEKRCKIADLPDEFFEGDTKDLETDFGSRLSTIAEDGTIDAEKSPLVWVVVHGMQESPEVLCPVCSSKARKVIQSVHSYFRGNCYLDIAGCKREMNIHKLKNDDPYGHMRQPGEKDDLINKLKRGNKPKPKSFIMPGTKKSE